MMKGYLSIALVAVWFNGGLAMAQSGGAGSAGSSAVGSTISGGSNYISSYNGHVASRDDDTVRLILQWAADQGGRFASYPSELSDAMLAAQNAGWLKMDPSSSVIGATSSTGFTSFILSAEGRKELMERNAKLGSAATRMAHGTQLVPGAGVVVYGAARRVPLDSPVHYQDGVPISNR